MGSVAGRDRDRHSVTMRTEAITKEDHRAWLRRLSSWQTASAMREKADSLVEQYGDSVLRSPRSAFFREAFCAARFAEWRQADEVRLVHPDPRPDFEIRFSPTLIEPFELVEADMPGRRRSLEYRANTGAAEPFPEEEWLTTAQARQLLQIAAQSKSDGRYDPGCGLLIYLNPTEFGVNQEGIEMVMKPATAAAAKYFRSVWVFWKGQAYQAW